MKHDDIEPHLLGRNEFIEEVHSFEFWFQAVEGYLNERPYGRSPGSHPELDEGERDTLITSLCNYCIGESAALEGSSAMVRLAPNHQAKVFLATQAVDEARHLEVLLYRLHELGVEDTEREIERRAGKSLLLFKNRLLELVDAGDWAAALFAQNVILEAMEFAVFEHHAEQADPITAEILRGIVADERRHMGFGENDLGRRLAQDPQLAGRLSALRRELDPLVLNSFTEASAQRGAPGAEQPKLGKMYLAAVSRLGFMK